MSNVDQAAFLSKVNDRARMDGLKLLAELFGLPQIQLARQAFDRLLYEHRDVLLANIDQHYEQRGDELHRLLQRSLKELKAEYGPTLTGRREAA